MEPESSLKKLSTIRSWASSGAARRIREAAGVSQSELARYIGVDHSCVSLWESGRRRPAGERAIAYADALEELMSP